MKCHAMMQRNYNLVLIWTPLIAAFKRAKWRKNAWRTSFCLSLLATCNYALAEAIPDAGTILRDVEHNLPPVPAKSLPPVESTDTVAAHTTDIKVLVKDFHILHVKLIPEDELKRQVVEFIDRELSFEQLQGVALRISDYYRKKGYFAHVFIARQIVENGIVEITVLEGTLGKVNVEAPAGARLNTNVVKETFLAQQKIGAPLRPDDAQRGLRILNEIPGYSAQGTLQQGEKAGETNLLIKAQDTPLLSGMGMLDSYGVKYTGENRFTGNVLINNPTGGGDQVGLLGLYSSGTQFARASYTTRIGYEGLRAGVNVSSLKYSVGGTFASLNAQGTADTWGLSANAPILRTTDMNVYWDAAFNHKHLVNNAQGANTSDNIINELAFTIRGDRLDEIAGRGINQYNLALIAGDAKYSNPVDLAQDLISANAHGSFQKITYTATRLQKITDTSGLFVNISGQFASKNLDSSEKFSLGGPNGIRAYPMGEASGDAGLLINAEVRHNLTDQLQLVGFLDTGYIQLNQKTWANWNVSSFNKPNTYQLSGTGISLNYTNKNGFMVRSSLAVRIGSNPGKDANGNDSDGSKSRARFWIQLSKLF